MYRNSASYSELLKFHCEYSEFKFMLKARQYPILLYNFIFNYGADINRMDRELRTPLSFLVQGGLHDCRLIQLALNRGADIFLQMSNTNTLTIAAGIMMSRDIWSIRVILKHMENKRSPLDNHFNTVLHYMAKYGVFILFDEVLAAVGGDINIKNIIQQTPLHLAVIEGNYEMVRKLLDLGANVNASSYGGNTPLMLAANMENYKYEAKLKIMKILVAHGAKVNVSNTNGGTAFSILCGYKETNLVLFDLLLDAGADVNVRNLRGSSALHFICASDLVDCTLLLDHGAEINAKTMDGYTPLYLSIYHGNNYNAEMLLLNGADLDIFLFSFNSHKQNAAMMKLLLTYIFLRQSYEPNWRPRDVQIFIELANHSEYYISHILSVLREIETMKEAKIRNSGISMWRIAISTVEQISKMFRIEEVKNAMMNWENFHILDHFRTCICRKTERAFNKRELYDKCAEKLPSVVKFPIPMPCVEKILNGLDSQSLKNILKVK